MRTEKKGVIAVLFLIIAAGAMLANCGGGGGSAPGTSATAAGSPSGGSASGASQAASVGLFMTDDASGFQQVSAVINAVTLLNTATGQSCTVLSSPVNINLANLADVMELVRTSNCPAGSFDTVRMAFSNAVGLTDSNGTSDTCTLTSFSPGQPSPDTLSCSGANCTMDLSSPVSAAAGQNNRVGLDFDLKNFNVTGFGNGACSMTMRVNSLSASQMDAKGFHPGISGMVANATGNTVTINTGTRSFIVNAASMGHPDFQGFMQTAQTKGIPALADCTNFDFNAGTCQASQVSAIAAGRISNLDPSNHTFMLTLNDGTQLNVAFPNASVKGMPENGQLSVVNLLNLNASAGSMSDASEVDNIPAGMGLNGMAGNNTPAGGNNGPAGGNTGSSGGDNTVSSGSGSAGMPDSGNTAPTGGSTSTSGSGNMGSSGGGNTGPSGRM